MDVEATSPLAELFESAEELTGVDNERAIANFRTIIASEESGDEHDKIKEQSLVKLGNLFARLGRAEELASLLSTSRAFFATIPKSRTAKIVRDLIDSIATIPNSLELQLNLCRECIEWCKAEKRTFLRQRLQARLAALLRESGRFQDALSLITHLVREVKRLDDKQLLVDIHMVEARIHHSLRNLPKAKAALTAARTASNSIYIPPLVQAGIDELAGTFQADERDYRTAFSYFFEAFEVYSQLEHPSAVKALKHMLMAKIMTGKAGEVHGILSGKHAVRYQGREVDAMRAVARAYQSRDLKQLNATLEEFGAELRGDALIQRHLQELHERLLEENLCRLIEPYARVEVEHLAALMELPRPRVEAKLSQMILDKRFEGTLDQGKGHLIIFDVPKDDPAFTAAIESIKGMGEVVESLFSRSEKLLAQ